jgi:nicotinamidase-related amidase
MKNALILIDIQNDYFPNGKMELVNMTNAAKAARQLLDESRKDNTPVIHIQHISTNKGATFFLPDTAGAEINDIVKPLANETVIIKHSPNSFLNTNLNDMLKKLSVETVTIVGAMTHVCIDSTARAAFDLGYKVIVVAEACATRDVTLNGKTVSAEDVQTAYLAGLGFVFAEIQIGVVNNATVLEEKPRIVNRP